MAGPARHGPARSALTGLADLLDAPVQRLLALADQAQASGQRVLVALAGLPGSGKSTAAQQWAQAVNQQRGPGTLLALGMDGFHLTKAQLATFTDPAAALQRRGSPWTFDAAALAQRLQALRHRQGPVSWPGFEHGVGDPVEGAVTVPAETSLLLVEGLYLLHTGHGWNLQGCFDQHWFLNVPMDVALDRLERRHMATSGQSRLAAQARIDMNDRLNAEIVQTSRSRTDWLVPAGFPV